MRLSIYSAQLTLVAGMLVAQVAAAPATTGNGQLAKRGFVTPPPVETHEPPPIRHENKRDVEVDAEEAESELQTRGGSGR
ncbi:hypothetical protein MCOR27_011443 [Pyricularia oryzae]|uniref:Uncharacterized protein n=2 Tax=Pyricularia TaxID=48558 RepID=A0ABQ8NI69_PYRGI|nr:hypothetical protein MCOR01_002870 [Pyricularia oryzae]KAI6297525.1 hypothetical protein MCOR33_006178 [Pyricularia grisea]KAH9432877.1 hypothetical protein MCOR02_007551 [Pyricularia oryzae]KAI6252016.1 hypothetical protein MCOR19_011364 [Pyricularia oryzae]KAI6265322.1 hypothetical protein MCOR27_011443 [Pyricularia oryzae]